MGQEFAEMLKYYTLQPHRRCCSTQGGGFSVKKTPLIFTNAGLIDNDTNVEGKELLSMNSK